MGASHKIPILGLFPQQVYCPGNLLSVTLEWLHFTVSYLLGLLSTLQMKKRGKGTAKKGFYSSKNYDKNCFN